MVTVLPRDCFRQSWDGQGAKLHQDRSDGKFPLDCQRQRNGQTLLDETAYLRAAKSCADREASSLRPDGIHPVRDAASAAKILLQSRLRSFAGRTWLACPFGQAGRRAYPANAAFSEIHQPAIQCPVPTALPAQTLVEMRMAEMLKIEMRGERQRQRDENFRPRVCVTRDERRLPGERYFHRNELGDGRGFSRLLLQRVSCKQGVV
jgi:hypothetical protein